MDLVVSVQRTLPCWIRIEIPNRYIFRHIVEFVIVNPNPFLCYPRSSAPTLTWTQRAVRLRGTVPLNWFRKYDEYLLLDGSCSLQR